MSNPLISLILPTKNSLPHLKNAIAGIKRQTYRNFEVIIQDGDSSDGTLEYVHSIKDLPKLKIFSEPDIGIGQAYNWGLTKSEGDFICFTASDECLLAHSLEMALSWFKKHPCAATIYGGIDIVNKNGKRIDRIIPTLFNLSKIMKCEVIPTFAGLFNRKTIGKELYYDESLKTCPDYDFWLRLGSRFSQSELIHRQELFMTAIGDRTSMSFRAEAYEQFAKDKRMILQRFLSQPTAPKQLKKEIHTFERGIMKWASHMALTLDGTSKVAARLQRAYHDYETHLIEPSKDEPVHTKRLPLKLFQHSHNSSLSLVASLFSKKLKITGGHEPYGYSAELPLTPTTPLKNASQYWLKVRLTVLKGPVGICLMHQDQIEEEKVIPAHSKSTIVYFTLSSISDRSLIIRNFNTTHTVAVIKECAIVGRTT